MRSDPKAFALEWIESWNSHDLDRILDHYSDDISVTSPMIKVALGIDDGTICGKEKVRQYWSTALQKVPDLHFELIETTECIDSVAVYYKSVMNKMAIEVMFFDENGKVNKMIAHYN